MSVTVSLYSTENGEIARFLHDFYEKNIEIKNGLEWEEEFKNPTQSASIIGAFIDNNEKFKINMWKNKREYPRGAPVYFYYFWLKILNGNEKFCKW